MNASNAHAYARSRSAFFNARPRLWADLDGSEYAVCGAMPVDADAVAAMRCCASDVASIYARLAPVLRALDDDALALLGIPASACALARDRWPLPDLLLARVDMIARGDGTYAAIECNADTPAFVFETHVMNGEIARACGLRDPNAGAEAPLIAALENAIASAYGELRRDPTTIPYVAFSAHRTAHEDRETAGYLRALASRVANVRTAFVPIDEVRLDAHGCYDADGARIDVLYHHYPMEGFAADRDADDGTPLGPLLFDLVLRRELALLNPPSGFLLQSKAVQAVVWGLYERNEVFDEHEREAIARSFLPTYCDPPAEGPYVVKPALGREGASVEIVAASLRTGRGPAPEAAPVYQRYVPMPRATVMTERGPRECCVLDTVFVVAGEATAVGRRLGGPVTDGAAYFTAIGVRA